MNTGTGHQESGSGLARIMERNIRALLTRYQEEQVHEGWQERAAAAITRFTGSMTFVYLHLLLFGGWIVINLGWMPGIRPFDPSFVVLAMIASVEAIFLSTFVLITQNRMAKQADKRADLDLQISLLAEHEVTRLIELVTAIAQHMEIDAARNPELSELANDVQPEVVLDRMDTIKQKVRQETRDKDRG